MHGSFDLLKAAAPQKGCSDDLVEKLFFQALQEVKGNPEALKEVCRLVDRHRRRLSEKLSNLFAERFILVTQKDC